MAGLVPTTGKRPSIYSIQFRHHGLQKITNGIKSGQIVEIRGESQTGKSWLLYELMSECEKMGGYNRIYDIEHALEKEYKPLIGLTDRTTEEDINVVERLVPNVIKYVEGIRAKNKKCPIIIGIDSWDRLKVKAVQDATDKGIEREIGATDAMRDMNVVWGNLLPMFQVLAEQDVVLVILNPLTVNYLVMFGDKTSSKGNQKLQYQCHLRLTGKLRGLVMVEVPSLAGTKKMPVGSTTEWTTTKNRGVVPFQSVRTKIRYAKGVDLFSGLEELLVNDETVVAELKVAAKPTKEKDTSQMTDKALRKHLAAEQVKKAKKANPSDFKFRLKSDKSETPTWFENIKDLVAAHPEALHPHITGEYQLPDHEELEEFVGGADEE